jgi:hypothetical protein
MIVPFLHCFILIFIFVFILVSSEASKPSSTNSLKNKYIQSSPPCIGAVCKDGIALLAIHTNIESEQRRHPQQEHQEKQQQLEEEIEGECEQKASLLDVPLSSRNPLRIERLDHRGSALLTCGWRADGMILANLGRDLCRDELIRYGPRKVKLVDGGDQRSDDNNNSNNMNDDYGNWLGWALVKQLVRYEARDNVSFSIAYYICCIMILFFFFFI